MLIKKRHLRSIYAVPFVLLSFFLLHTLLTGLTQRKKISFEEYCTEIHRILLKNNGRVPEHSSGPEAQLFSGSEKAKLWNKEPNGEREDFYTVRNFLFYNCLEQDDPTLVESIATPNRHFVPPSQDPYCLDVNGDEEEDDQNIYDLNTWFRPDGKSILVKNKKENALDRSINVTSILCATHTTADYVDRFIFKRQLKNGFFIESGAFKADMTSISLMFEVHYNWTGLLIEPDQQAFGEGLMRNRKSTYVHTCLAVETRPHSVELGMSDILTDQQGNPAMSHIMMPDEPPITNFFKVQCLPLYSLLLAIGNPTVNLWILDVEGFEFDILKTVPWDRVDIEVLVVETHLAFPGSVLGVTREEILEYMINQGYYHFVPEFELKGRPNNVPVNDYFVSWKAMKKYKLKPHWDEHGEEED